MAWQLSAISPSEPSEICSACKRITFEMIFTGFQHELTYKQTIESGRRCSLCRLMVCSYARLQTRYNVYEANENYEFLVPQLQSLKSLSRSSLSGASRRELGPVIERAVGAPAHLCWTTHPYWQNINGCFSDGATIQVSAPEDSQYLSNVMIELREISAANSNRNIGLLNGWLRTCIDEHIDCQLSLSGSSLDDKRGHLLPTRIIDVGCLGSSTGPRLYENKCERAQYVALSHRWGEVLKLRLTQDTLKVFKASLPLESLPLTYKDAISVTRSLGIRYVWIDSLCIIQDDRHDWEQEASRMGDIFEQATLTIAAVDAIDDATGADRGLLMARKQDPLAVTLECDFDENNVNPPTPGDPYWESMFQRLPIAPVSPEGRKIVLRPRWKGLWHTMEDTQWRRRAWVMQERTLSRRVIYYTKRKIFWECQHSSSDEENRPNDVPPLRAQIAKSFRGVDTSSSRRLSDHETYSAWWNHVEDYSSCLLTEESDKLAACQGLCNRVEKCVSEGMFGGIILDASGINLLWRISADTLDTSYTDFHAPTWSWLSIKGPVKYHDYSIEQHPQPQLSDIRLEVPSECFQTKNGSKCRHGICGALSFRTDFAVLLAAESFQYLQYRSNSTLIKILGSSIHFESSPMPRQVQPHILDIAQRKLSLPNSTQVLRTKGSNDIVGWVLLDRPSSPTTPKEIVCATIALRQACARPSIAHLDDAIRDFDYYHKQNIDFIALEWVEGQNTHRRVERGRVIVPSSIGE